MQLLSHWILLYLDSKNRKLHDAGKCLGYYRYSYVVRVRVLNAGLGKMNKDISQTRTHETLLLYKYILTHTLILISHIHLFLLLYLSWLYSLYWMLKWFERAHYAIFLMHLFIYLYISLS